MIESIILLLDSPPVIIFSDDFNRADGPLAAPWFTSGGTWAISNNRLNNSVTGAARALYQSGVSNCQITLTMSVYTAITKIIFRYVDDNNEWSLNASSTSFNISKKVAGSITIMTTVSVTPKNNDIISIKLVGNTIEFFLNGVSQAPTIADNFNQTATIHGVGTAGTATPLIDNFIIQGV